MQFNAEEKKILEFCSSESLTIFSEINISCYKLNIFGELTYEQCFGKTDNSYLKKQRYNKAIPNRLIKYERFYMLEDINEKGDQYVGEMNGNNTIEFLIYAENLDYAFGSL